MFSSGVLGLSIICEKRQSGLVNALVEILITANSNYQESEGILKEMREQKDKMEELLVKEEFARSVSNLD